MAPQIHKTMVSALDRLTYAARQTARVAWYAGHYAAGRRLLKPMPKPGFPVGPTPSREEMTNDMRAVTFCGHAPFEEHPYCEYHHRLAYRPEGERNRLSRSIYRLTIHAAA